MHETRRANQCLACDARHSTCDAKLPIGVRENAEAVDHALTPSPDPSDLQLSRTVVLTL